MADSNIALFITILLLVGLTTAENRTQLFKDLFKDYEVRVAPFDTLADVMILSMSVSIISLRNVNEKDQTFSASVWISLSWLDERLEWEAKSYKGINSIQTTSKYVWIPSSICIFNEVTNDKCLTEEKPVTIYSSGHLVYTTSRESTAQCKIDVSKYPFDTQICSLYIGNLFVQSEFIYLSSSLSTYSLVYFDRNEEWEVLNAYPRDYTGTGATQIHFDLVVKRKSSYIVLTVLLPVILLSVLNIFSFVLPIDSGEKMGTSMAIFLTFAVFLTIINDSLPKTDSIPPFTVYLTIQLVISGLTVMLEAIVLRVHFSGKSDDETDESNGSLSKTKIQPIDMNDEEGEIRVRNKICYLVKYIKSKLTAERLDRFFMVLVIVVDLISLTVFLAETL